MHYDTSNVALRSLMSKPIIVSLVITLQELKHGITNSVVLPSHAHPGTNCQHCLIVRG